MKKMIQSLIALGFAAVSGIAMAQTNQPELRVDQVQANQVKRIEQGAHQGQMTAHETKRAMQGQSRIQRMESHAKMDGKITKREHYKIRQAQHVQSKKIHNMRHNRKHMS